MPIGLAFLASGLVVSSFVALLDVGTGLLLNMSDLAGALVFSLTFLLPLAFREFRRNGRAVVAYWFVLALHHAVALTNAYWFTVFGADADAKTFQRIGVDLAARGEWSFHVGSKFYEQMLGLVYRTSGPSHLMGQELSILAFAFSCVVLLKLLRLLDCRGYSWAVLLVFGGLPTMVLLGSVTLRESYQILFFMLAVYLAAKFHAERRARRFFAMALAALAMGLFHKGLMLYALFMLLIAGVWKVERAHTAGPIWTARPVIWAYALSGAGLVLALPAIAPYTAGLYQRTLALTAVRPLSHADGHDLPWTFDEAVPGLASGVDDGVVVVENAV